MADTEFSAFAQKMAVVFRGDEPPEAFAKALFAAIYLPNKEEDPVDETLPRTYRSYFYGERNITDLAKSIADSLDPENFAEEFTSANEATRLYLCEAFDDVCPDINISNYPCQIANRFRKIINTAAAPQKRKRRSNADAVECKTIAKDRHGVFLVAETGSVCPNDGCFKSLYKKHNGRLELVYDVAVIDPTMSDDDTENLIALCPNCCATYSAMRTAETLSRMKEIKKELVQAYEAREIAGDQTVQDAVGLVVAKIPKLSRPVNVDLNYNPVTVRQKIAISNEMLYSKAQMHVNMYYPAVNEAFREMSTEGKLRFSQFSLQVRAIFLGLQEKEYTQDKIYYELTKWLFDATNENWSACEVVISYFIQKCEVFDAVAQ